MANPNKQRTAVSPGALDMCGSISDAEPPARALQQQESSLGEPTLKMKDVLFAYPTEITNLCPSKEVIVYAIHASDEVV